MQQKMTENIFDRFVIGTANFLNEYGLVPSRVDIRNVKYILDAAKEHGIKKIDTAQAYGEIEDLLLNQYSKDFEITTKITINEYIDIFHEATKYSKLKSGNILIHNYQILETQAGADLALKVLKKISDKNQNLSVGFSVYDECQIKKIELEGRVLQIPYNKFINRFNFILRERCKLRKLQIRSIFMQGLIFKTEKDLMRLPPEFSKSLDELKGKCKSVGISLIDFCVFYSCESGSNIEIVTGISSYNQLKEILNSINKYIELKKNGENFDFLKYTIKTGDWADPRHWSYD